MQRLNNYHNITGIEVIIKPLDYQDLIAKVDLIFYDSQGNKVFVVRGVSIKNKLFGDRRTLVVDFPAYKTRRGYQKSFYIDDKNLYSEVCNLVLQAYAQKTGGLNPDQVVAMSNGEEVGDKEDYPF
jgi:hypothetical protein